ncbi:hypothetical protein LSH36_473g02031 [Paralvinella palmiformis]|uniref:Uncharacterized protein n=1 Tax=Paralvinella palmiformis TaxID=53620 RepID=A0AAD9JAN4_9ANNE|nr:hypothetical protein LSH36_473g02031 [Paralvinella palmiformis]
MATTSLETRRPYSEKKQLVVRINERRSANVPGALQCARCDDGTGKLARCAFWVQGIIALLVLVWIGYAHARLLAYDRELEQITRHVTVLQKHVNRLRLVNKYGGSVMVDDGKHSLHDATNVDDVGLDLPNTSHVTQSRTRRAGRHHSPVDDELQTKPADRWPIPDDEQTDEDWPTSFYTSGSHTTARYIPCHEIVRDNTPAGAPYKVLRSVYVFQAGDELAIDIDRGVNSGDICRVNYDAAKTFFGIFWLGSTHLE